MNGDYNICISRHTRDKIWGVSICFWYLGTGTIATGKGVFPDLGRIKIYCPYVYTNQGIIYIIEASTYETEI